MVKRDWPNSPIWVWCGECDREGESYIGLGKEAKRWVRDGEVGRDCINDIMILYIVFDYSENK